MSRRRHRVEAAADRVAGLFEITGHWNSLLHGMSGESQLRLFRTQRRLACCSRDDIYQGTRLATAGGTSASLRQTLGAKLRIGICPRDIRPFVRPASAAASPPGLCRARRQAADRPPDLRTENEWTKHSNSGCTLEWRGAATRQTDVHAVPEATGARFEAACGSAAGVGASSG